LRVGVRQPHDPLSGDALENPATWALRRIQTFERIAGTQSRVSADPVEDERGVFRDDDRASGLRLAAPPLDDQLLIAEPQAGSVVELCAGPDWPAVQKGPVARACVGDDGRLAVGAGRDPSVVARDGRIDQHHHVLRCSADRHLAGDRDAPAIRQHELEL
jgi:hypothetical protein